jgi:hypothetical protein
VHTTHNEVDLRLRVDTRTTGAEGVVLDLRDPSGAELPAWAAGAHVDLILPEGMTRQYSLCGAPDDRSVWRIAVLREPESRAGSCCAVRGHGPPSPRGATRAHTGTRPRSFGAPIRTPPIGHRRTASHAAQRIGLSCGYYETGCRIPQELMTTGGISTREPVTGPHRPARLGRPVSHGVMPRRSAAITRDATVRQLHAHAVARPEAEAVQRRRPASTAPGTGPGATCAFAMACPITME